MSRFGLGLCGLVVVGLLACSGDADNDPAADEPEATVSVAPPPTIASDTTTANTTAATTANATNTMPGPSLSERFELIEVSARITADDTERIVSVVSDAEQLVDVVDPDDRAVAAAWCSGVVVADPGPFLIRVADEAVGSTTGGLVGFELLGVEPIVESGEIVATLRLGLDDGDLVLPEASVLLADDPTTGTFAGATADGTVVEGAFRCE